MESKAQLTLSTISPVKTTSELITSLIGIPRDYAGVTKNSKVTAFFKEGKFFQVADFNQNRFY